jgi:hypothetical protein
MSIQKKSLISALKTTKKANVASAPVEGKSATSMKKSVFSAKGIQSAKGVSAKGIQSAKGISAKGVQSAKGVSAKKLVE